MTSNMIISIRKFVSGKKFISAILLASFFFALIGVTVTSSLADTELVIEVGDASFDTADASYVNVPVYIAQNASGFIDMQFSVKFDPNTFSSINNVVIPTDSMLYYALDASIMDVTEKPTVIAGADNENGLVRIAMSGVFQKNTAGESEQYVFLNTGIMFNLRMKLRDDVEYISNSNSEISVQVSKETDTPFIFRTASGDEVALENVSAKAGNMSIQTSYTVTDLSIDTYDIVTQKVSDITPVNFTAAVTCDGIYPQSDIEWFVNGELLSCGAEFAYTPPATEGFYTVSAKIADTVSNEIIVSVGSLKIPEAPEAVEGKQFIGYSVKVNGYEMLLPAGTDFMGSANELKEAQPIWFSVEMENGAAVKLTEPAGLKFTAKVDAQEYEALFAAAGKFNLYLGMIIAPTDIVDSLDDFTIDELENYGYPASMRSSGFASKNSEANGGYYTYTGFIKNILENNYNRQFSARAYAEITYSNGKEIIVYSDYIEENNSRSVSEVAYAAINDTSAEYTKAQRTVLKMFIDGDVNIKADGTPLYVGTDAYTPPYDSTLSANGKTVFVAARNSGIWLADDVCAVTYNGERLAPQNYTVKGSKLVITLE